MKPRLPKHWSEWLACCGMLAFTAYMAHFCWWCSIDITRDGGGSFWAGLVVDFRALTGWW